MWHEIEFEFVKSIQFPALKSWKVRNRHAPIFVLIKSIDCNSNLIACNFAPIKTFFTSRSPHFSLITWLLFIFNIIYYLFWFFLIITVNTFKLILPHPSLKCVAVIQFFGYKFFLKIIKIINETGFSI